MKRFIALFMCFVLLFSLVGCGENKPVNTDEPSTTENNVFDNPFDEESTTTTTTTTQTETTTKKETTTKQETTTKKIDTSMKSIKTKTIAEAEKRAIGALDFGIGTSGERRDHNECFSGQHG